LDGVTKILDQGSKTAVTLNRRRLKPKKSPTAIRAAKALKQIKEAKKARTTIPAARAIYWPDHVDEIKAIAMTGMTDDEMAAALGIKEEQLEAWKQYYPSFAAAIDAGRTNADAQVVAALHANAIGFKYIADEVVKTKRGAQVIQVEKHFLPETQAQKFWLTNRKPEWRAAQLLNVGGQRGGHAHDAISVETKAMVIHSILNLITPQPDTA
jgi:DNA-binding transcriptional regulator YiaG